MAFRTAVTRRQVNCSKCNRVADQRDTVQCSTCKCRYDFDCVGLSQKLYNIMEVEKKRKWRCPQCIKKTKEVKPNTEFSATTAHTTADECLPSTSKRCPARKQDIELLMMETPSDVDNTSDEFDLSLTSVSKSMTMEKESEEIKDLKERIETLTTELCSTQQEMENTIIENGQLKQQVMKLSDEIKILKNICRSPSTNKSEHKRKRDSTLNTYDLTITSTPPRTKLQKNNKDEIVNTQFLECQISKLQNQLQEAKNEIKTLEGKIKELEEKYQNEELEYDSNIHKYVKNYDKKDKSKLTIISSNKYNKILEIAEDSLSDVCKICHYLTPGVGIKELMKNVEYKLQNHTMNDFCLFMIGKEDFETSSNLIDLVLYIKNRILQSMNHTNIVICVPTYDFGKNKNFFNARVETFNQLLHLDNITSEYAYLVDSNRNLSYDYDMFPKHSGKINNTAMKVIFQDVKKTLHDILCEETKYTETSTIKYTDMEKLKENEQLAIIEEDEMTNETIKHGNDNINNVIENNQVKLFRS